MYTAKYSEGNIVNVTNFMRAHEERSAQVLSQDSYRNVYKLLETVSRLENGAVKLDPDGKPYTFQPGMKFDVVSETPGEKGSECIGRYHEKHPGAVWSQNGARYKCVLVIPLYKVHYLDERSSDEAPFWDDVIPETSIVSD